MEPPWEWTIGQVCEAFHIGTLEALKQLAHEPNGLSRKIMELRAYAETYWEVERARITEINGGDSDLEITPLVELVQANQIEVDQEIADELLKDRPNRRRSRDG